MNRLGEAIGIRGVSVAPAPPLSALALSRQCPQLGSSDEGALCTLRLGEVGGGARRAKAGRGGGR